MPSRDMPPRRGVPKGLDPEDFDAIQDAVMETQRGRWFLDEFAMRLRRSETAVLHDSLRRLETAVASNHDEIMDRLAAALGAGAEDEASPAPPVETEDEMRLAPRHMKYYRADEDLFEAATGLVPEPVMPVRPRLLDMLPPEQDALPPRRRIVITRRKPGEPFEVPLAEDLPKAS